MSGLGEGPIIACSIKASEMHKATVEKPEESAGTRGVN